MPFFSLCSNQIDDLLRIGLFHRQVAKGDVRALTGKRDGRRSSDSRIATGDQCLSPDQLAGAFVTCLSMIRARDPSDRQVPVLPDAARLNGGCTY